MKRYARLLAAAISLALMAACSSTPEQAPPQFAQTFKRVGVVSTIGDVMRRTYVGMTVFGNERYLDPLPEGLDRIYETQIADILRGSHGLVVAPPVPSPAAFAAVNTGKAPDWLAAAPAVATYCATNSLDAVFLVAKQGEAALVVNTERSLQAKTEGLFVYAEVALYDCGTGQPLAARPLERRRSAGSMLFGDNLIRPWSGVLPSRWPTSGPWNQEVMVEVKAWFAELADTAWPETLRNLLAANRK